ncbi:MAG: ATP-binding cassette domain-containing protein [Candidatus Omnitrophica bacterium]|nr:ATP-binding cassette domain-containing protein [Candidatus Omnitrophota bacterium]
MKIICERISKEFTTARGPLRVLEDFSAETREHDLVCIMGPNGCGKSTLLNIMAGIIQPSSGRVVFEGGEPVPRPATLVFPEDGLFPWMDILDNVCFGLKMSGVPQPKRYEMAEALLNEMGLMPFTQSYPYQLSTGMKQKACLIRGLLTDAPVILMDEPDKSLDIYSKFLLCDDIHRVWERYRKTVVCVTHDIDMAMRLARTIWVLGRRPATIVKTIDLGEPGVKDNAARLEGWKREIAGIIRGEAEKRA